MGTQSFNKTPNIIEVSLRSEEPPFNLQLKSVSNTILVEKKPIRDIFLNGNESFKDAEVFYSSKMNDVEKKIDTPVQAVRVDVPNKEPEHKEMFQVFLMPVSKVQNIPDTPVGLAENGGNQSSPFIIANTSEATLHHLQNDCIIPVFSKDNEKTIAHQEFIEVVLSAVQKVFPHYCITEPEIRVSHQIKGRTPSAIQKPVKELLEHEKTIYYERMAFIIKVPTITDIVNGDELSLTIGGVRSYNLENLYNKKSLEKFKFFIGFQNQVCMNLCVSSDGFVEDMKAGSTNELYSKTLETMQNYNAELHLMEMKELSQYFLSDHQFAQLIGRSRLYQHLPKSEKQNIPLLNFNDSHINAMAKDYYEDQNFCRNQDGNINLWDVYNLFTQANKSSYIDTFLDRNLNAFEFSKGIQKVLNGNSNYHWFLS
ncbi:MULTISPECIES: DUF3871 family protein [unclassified Chryseobacterium]|uniref:DUF3871 family protein n=1 Tax=unclassified Chryseobacterium TaxID=2593645 RepID=UPI00100C0113|nr:MULTISPECIES: DUF3871 family protein [unclassified Chryseobacterium]RXM50000.1 hypothetical protein BOQ64_21005 [Chryseobacterium sp. CH25]RXM62918.1 hypothetical protein BOQ60_18760 [Chryseobacterium sp. CH1]